MARTAWNDGWEFLPVYNEAILQPGAQPEGLEQVRLPHSAAYIPYNYTPSSVCEGVCGYRRRFLVPEAWRGQRVLLTFEGAAHYAELFLDGQPIGRHAGGYTAFTIDLTPHLRYDTQMLLAVKLDSRESLDIPPFGGVIDYLTYSGLYREVYLEVKNPRHISDVFAYSGGDTLHTGVCLYGGAAGLRVEQALLDVAGNTVAELAAEAEETGGQDTAKGENAAGAAFYNLSTALRLPGAARWCPENPVLYTLRTRLYEGGTLLDERVQRTAFRDIHFAADGFYLNGKKTRLFGLNRHQAYPYVGYAMPRRPQQADADIMKYELGLNAVRTSHYPQSHHFLDRCDEIGLLVFTELPGWQHIGGAAWQESAVQQLEEMVLQYRNHPSIILWGTRINESPDDDAFYARTNAAAKSLDPTRPTSGVRFIQQSSLLEDVYAYNDFVHTGENRGVDPKARVTPQPDKPYLISEYNGHMFPTKSFDNEARRLQHALRHARVVDAYTAAPGVAGGFGWCLFDYNTHKDFGSGDGICYHGVLDMFRGPKLAAAVYASQSEIHPVLEISSGMDIGEYPGGSIGTVYAFTNADSVRLYKNGEFVKEFYPDYTAFPALPHPPIAIDDFVGGLLAAGEGYSEGKAEGIKAVLRAVGRYGQNDLPLRYKLKMARLMAFHGLKLDDGIRLYGTYFANWGGKATVYRFDAMKNGRVVASTEKAPLTGIALRLYSDTDTLHEGDSYDVASIRIRACDALGNTLRYYMEPVALEVTGPVALIGPAAPSLKGGMGGTYLRTTGGSGPATLTATLATGQSETLAFSVTAN